MKLLCRLFSLIAGITLATHFAARAQDYPARPVTIVVPYTPAGSTDIMARMIGQKLEEARQTSADRE